MADRAPAIRKISSLPVSTLHRQRVIAKRFKLVAEGSDHMGWSVDPMIIFPTQFLDRAADVAVMANCWLGRGHCQQRVFIVPAGRLLTRSGGACSSSNLNGTNTNFGRW